MKKPRKTTKATKRHRLADFPEVVTIGEVSEVLRMEEETVRRHLVSGTIPGVKVGGRWRVYRDDLLALVNRCRRALVPVSSPVTTESAAAA